ncbi:MAG: hypothetical protein NVSMB19_21490 [Vulcanimicrobiaceae bacterium]
MNGFPLRVSASAALALGMAFSCTFAAAGATAQSARPARVIGSYVATHLNGTSVVRLELSLARDGSARLRTGASRYSQRPAGVDGASVVETGTWRLRGGRVVLHIERSSTTADGAKDGPRFADRTFVISGCALQLVGSALAFDKQHCS